MTENQVKEMKSSWTPEQIKIFFDSTLGIFKPLMSTPNALDPLHGQVLYYCSLLFVGGLIYSLSKEAQRKIFRKVSDLLYSCKFEKGMYASTAIKVHLSILKYEEKKLNEDNKASLAPKIREREAEVARLKSL